LFFRCKLQIKSSSSNLRNQLMFEQESAMLLHSIRRQIPKCFLVWRIIPHNIVHCIYPGTSKISYNFRFKTNNLKTFHLKHECHLSISTSSVPLLPRLPMIKAFFRKTNNSISSN
jgi:hypothetical protein